MFNDATADKCCLREIERTIRREKRLRDAYKAAGLTEDAQNARIRLRRLNEKYREFSAATGLPEQRERLRVLYGDEKSAKAAAVLKVQRDAEAPVRAAIRRGDYPLIINPEKQARHMEGTALPGRSVITISMEELQEIIDAQAGNGKILFVNGTFNWTNQEIVSAGKKIGYTINKNGDIIKTDSIKIHFSKTGVHAVPFSGRWKK